MNIHVLPAAFPIPRVIPGPQFCLALLKQWLSAHLLTTEQWDMHPVITTSSAKQDGNPSSNTPKPLVH